MAPSYPGGSGSLAAFRRHPLHPMLVPLPISFLVGAFVSDVVFASTRDGFWAEASFWLLIGGFGAGVLAAIPGAVDLLRVERASSLPAALVHGLGNILALLIAFANLALRWDQQSSSVMWTGLALSTIIVTILLVTSWVGGELSYKHGVGVSTSIGEGSPRDGSA